MSVIILISTIVILYSFILITITTLILNITVITIITILIVILFPKQCGALHDSMGSEVQIHENPSVCGPARRAGIPIFIVNPRKLEHGFRRISARISYTLP